MKVLIGFYSIFRDLESLILSLVRALEDTGLDYDPKKLEGKLPDSIYFALESILPEDYPKEQVIKMSKEAGKLILKTNFRAREYLGVVLDNKRYDKIMVSPEKSGFTNKVLSKLNIREKFDLIATRETRSENISNVLGRTNTKTGALISSSSDLLEKARSFGYVRIGLGKGLKADKIASNFLEVSSILEQIHLERNSFPLIKNLKS